MHPKAKLQNKNAPTFTGNGSHSHVSTNDIQYTDTYINFISVTCSPHRAKTTIGQYQRTNLPIMIIGRLSVHLCFRSTQTFFHTADHPTKVFLRHCLLAPATSIRPHRIQHLTKSTTSLHSISKPVKHNFPAHCQKTTASIASLSLDIMLQVQSSEQRPR